MPLDVNLPTFHIAPRPREPHITTLSYTSNGSSPQPTYNKTLSAQPANTYTVALHDAFVPDILYASISAHPEIHPSTATASPGGTPPDPKVLLPAEFEISLFNPDSTVIVEHHHSTLRGTHWEFTLPKTSFLPPSSSKLDAASSAAALSHLPKATFRWRKEGGIMTRAQLRCSLVSPANLPTPSGGASTKKAGANEPDIPIAMFTNIGDKRGTGEITIYQSNLKRVEVEDLKGLEVVLLLSAMAIGDIWFLPTNIIFNLNPPIRGGAGGTSRRKNSFPLALAAAAAAAQPPAQPPAPPTTSPQTGKSPPNASFAARFQAQEQSQQRRHSTPAEKDSEYARRMQEEDTRARALAAEREQAQIRRMLAEEEQRERRRKEEEIDRETERLKRIYERERNEHMARGARSAQTQRVPSQQRVSSQQRPPAQVPHQRQPSVQQRPPSVVPQQRPQAPQRPVSMQRPPQIRPPVVGGSNMAPPAGRVGALKVEEKKLSNRRSFLGLKFGGSSEEKKKKKLSKKSSSMF